MALPSSGVIYLSQIKSYFGETTPPQYLTSYNRGGTYVQNIPANTNIPTSASPADPIYITDFRGSSDPETQTIASGSATLTAPPYQTNVTIDVWGGGGGGSGLRSFSSPIASGFIPSGGGGGGGYAYKSISFTSGASYSYTVGAGGNKGTTAQNGQAGGSSAFTLGTTTLTATGGAGGSQTGGAGGTQVGGTTPRSESGQAGTITAGGNAGGIPYGGGLGSTTYSPGQVPGGGGSGVNVADPVPAGFNGANGRIVLTWS